MQLTYELCYALKAMTVLNFQRCAFYFIMVALRTRCGHYISPCGFFLSFYLFSSPNLSGRRLDVYHISTHGVALGRI